MHQVALTLCSPAQPMCSPAQPMPHCKAKTAPFFSFGSFPSLAPTPVFLRYAVARAANEATQLQKPHYFSSTSQSDVWVSKMQGVQGKNQP